MVPDVVSGTSRNASILLDKPWYVQYLTYVHLDKGLADVALKKEQ